MKWADLLRVQEKMLTAPGVKKFHRWIVNSIATNQPYDQFVQDLLVATGSVFSNPEANFYRAATNPEDCAETTAELFLGVKIKCAKCHNHPFDRWTQDNYHGLASLFQRVARKPGGRADELIVFSNRHGELMHPRTGERVLPWLPGVGHFNPDDVTDRRESLAEWLRMEENPFFARVAVNRVWSFLFGRGLVEPVDDFRDSNPAVNPLLLDAMASDFVQHAFDRKQVLQKILNSRTYQLSAVPNSWNRDDETFFSRYRPRRLSAEQLLDAMSHVTGVPNVFPDVPRGTRVVARATPPINHSFLSSFGQPERNSACQCERVKQINFSQALQLMNGPLLQEKLRDPNGCVQQGISTGLTSEEIVEDLYWLAYSRPPTTEELTRVLKHVETIGDPLRGLQDCCWALMNSQRFVFEH